MTQRHGIDVVPSQAMTSPHGVDVQPGEEPQWWTPSWSEIAAHLGWRWILFAPAILLFIGICLTPFRPGYIRLLYLWKPIAVLVLLPTGAAMRSIKLIVQNRKDPFCIHCGYSLVGLEEGHRCPECGRRFSLAVINEYRRDPHWFIQRWKTLQTTMPSPVTAFESGAPTTTSTASASPTRRRKSRDGT